MQTLKNYLKYRLKGTTTQAYYQQMRADYRLSTKEQINWVSRLQSFLTPKYRIKKSVGVLGNLGQQDVNKIVKEITNEGYYVFPIKLSNEVVKDIKSFAENTPVSYLEIDEHKIIKYSQANLSYTQSREKSNRHQFHNVSVYNKNENIVKLILDRNFLHIANTYLNTKPILDIVTMWWSQTLQNFEGESKEILKNTSAQMFHFDMDRLMFLKFFVYLTDVDTNTGPHVYVKKSNRVLPPYIKQDGRYTDELIYDNDNNNVVEILGKAGSIIAVDTRGLHKGKELNEGERLIFQIEFTNSLFGKPETQMVEEKINYNGDPSFFDTYKLYFKK